MFCQKIDNPIAKLSHLFARKCNARAIGGRVVHFLALLLATCDRRFPTGLHSPVKVIAVLMSETCENACGKFPSWRFDVGSYSSESSPRSFRTESRRSKSSRASFLRPIRSKQEANQNEQGRNTPSPPGNPST